MTTLTEFKEIEIHDMDDTEITRLYENAFPALIAVAEGMAWALKNSRFILIAEGIDDTGVVNEALAAYEAWKLNIEGERL